MDCERCVLFWHSFLCLRRLLSFLYSYNNNSLYLISMDEDALSPLTGPLSTVNLFHPSSASSYIFDALCRSAVQFRSGNMLGFLHII
ncbi:hypothetical protein BDZ97DRAFT_1810727 [Flammula alnicola]|nr:hypothetical protein BDZ97DRAFT_1810727 [Flammula alnicola]